MKIHIIIISMMTVWMIACNKKQINFPVLQMTEEEIVEALVHMYSANAAININDASLRDSTSSVYFQQIATMSGKSIDVIKSDFEKLQLMQDSLIVLQNRALDTLRALQERQLNRRPVFNLNLN